MAESERLRIRYLVTLATLGGSFFPVIPSAAQLLPSNILPDNSLGQESSLINSQVNVEGQRADVISGGVRRGNNLFHSFQEFNIGNLQRVYFANPVGVENILSRVTGTNPSNIQGRLGVLGTANLFLINPNGILFGPNASLDLRGSFVASTASSIQFADGSEFSAVNPAASLLTVSVPIGLQFRGGEGNIVVQAGQPPAPTNRFTEVGDAGQSLDTAQVVNPSTSGASLDAIVGNLNDVTDVDLYQLFLTQGKPFTASTVGGTHVNTELFLFDSNGLGVAANNDGVGFQSIVPLYQPFIPPRSGIYYLGISSYSISPRSAQGDIFDVSETPKGPGAALPLSGWDGIPGPSVRPNSGPYTITLTSRSSGLQVQPGKTLALVGGNVRLEGGKLQAPGGRVELAGVAGPGTVGFTQNGSELRLNLPDGLAKSNVFLTQNALVDVSAGGGGSIAINARNLEITASSLLAGMAPGLGSVGSRAGDVELQATEAIILDASNIINDVATRAIGDSGNFNITARSFSATNGAGLYTRIYGEGKAGNLNITARDAVSFDYSLAYSVIDATGKGQGGDIRITADSVSVTNIAQLAVLTQGKGDAGNIEINARDTVRFAGRDNRLEIYSAAFSSVGDSSAAGIQATGRGGDIRITAGSVAITNSAKLLANTNGVGNAGNVIIHARDTVSFDGEAGAFSSVAPTGIGNGGSISITSRSLLLTNRAEVGVGNAGSGLAGSLSVQADTLQLSNQGKISADTNGGGGNIALKTNFLTMRQGSSITTNATGTATGGNININAGFIVSAPKENNDIIANAFAGSGGKITLATQNIFWFNLRSRQELQRLLNTTNPAELDPRRLPTNDITAFSQANPTIDTGTVTLRTPDLDPTRGLTALPTDLTDPSQLIAATCPADVGSSFAITGRGGLPEDPRQPLMGQVIWQDERQGAQADDRDPQPLTSSQPPTPTIVEAQGWIVDRTGTVVLVARQPAADGSAALRYPPCALSQRSP